MSVLDSKFKNTDQSVSELKERLTFCDEEIVDIKKATYDLKENHSLTSEQLRKQILYLECYSRRENLKFIGVTERIISGECTLRLDEKEETSEDTAEVVYKFLEEELDIKDSHQKVEFQRVYRSGKQGRNVPRPILVRFLRYADREEAFYRKHAGSFPVYEDILKDLYDIRKGQMSKLKAAKKKKV